MNPLRLLQLSVALTFFSLFTLARAESAAPTFQVLAPKGEVSWINPATGTTLKVKGGETLPQGATVITTGSLSVVILFRTGSTVTLGSGTTVQITKSYMDAVTEPSDGIHEPAVSATELKLVSGDLISSVRKLKTGSSFVINTPVGAAGVRGTEFEVNYNPSTGSLHVSTADGLVDFSTPDGTVTPVAGGSTVSVTATVDAQGNVTITGVAAGTLSDEVRAAIVSAVTSSQAAASSSGGGDQTGGGSGFRGSTQSNTTADSSIATNS